MKRAESFNIHREMPEHQKDADSDWFEKQGETSKFLAGINWQNTLVGPIESWPQCLQTAFRIGLLSRLPVIVLWGAEFLLLYNEAGSPLVVSANRPQAMGQPAPEICPEWWNTMAPVIRKVMASSEAACLEDQVFVSGGNHYKAERYFTVFCSPIVDSDGSTAGVLAVFHETTKRTITETRLRALISTLSAAEERDRRRLAAELHDHLTQLLVVARMGIMRAKQTAQDARLADSLAETDSILDQSLAYTRTLIADLSPRVLYDLGLGPALKWLAEQMRRHGLTVDVSGTSDELTLQEYQATFIFQCVRELLWNIVKHAHTERATVSHQLNDGELTVVVADAGKGFDPKILRQAELGITRFGLFSMRERVEVQGGHFELHSAPGQGTRVTLRVPVASSRSKRVIASLGADSELKCLDGKHVIRVVLVDDHQMVRQGLRSVLQDHPEFTIVGEAGNGLEAIALTQRVQPDVVVMDLNLPIVNGIEATRRIMQERPSTIVIGLSFGVNAYITDAMKAAGAVTCVTKERAVEDLYRTIKDSVAQAANS